MTGVPNFDPVEMKTRAEAATKGSWLRFGARQRLGEESCITVGTDADGPVAWLPIGSRQRDKFFSVAFNDAAHIATSNPSAVLALLTAYDEQVERVKELKAALGEFASPERTYLLGSKESRAAALLATPTHSAGQEGGENG